MSVKLVEFPVVPLTDIPARLRLLAEQIEDGEFDKVQNVAIAVENVETVRVVTFGRCDDPFRMSAVMNFAAGILVEPGE